LRGVLHGIAHRLPRTPALEDFVVSTVTTNSAAEPAAKAFSRHCGEKMRVKPWPFHERGEAGDAEGHEERRKTCQPPSRVLPPLEAEVVLMKRAMPTMALKPREVNQRRGFASKYRHASTTRYQMK